MWMCACKRRLCNKTKRGCHQYSLDFEQCAAHFYKLRYSTAISILAEESPCHSTATLNIFLW